MIRWLGVNCWVELAPRKARVRLALACVRARSRIPLGWLEYFELGDLQLQVHMCNLRDTSDVPITLDWICFGSWQKSFLGWMEQSKTSYWWRVCNLVIYFFSLEFQFSKYETLLYRSTNAKWFIDDISLS